MENTQAIGESLIRDGFYPVRVGDAEDEWRECSQEEAIDANLEQAHKALVQAKYALLNIAAFTDNRPRAEVYRETFAAKVADCVTDVAILRHERTR